MNFATLKAQSPSPRRVSVLAATALVLYTIVAGFAGDRSAFAVTKTPSTGPYSIKVTGTRSGELVTVHAAVRDNRSQQVVAATAFNLNSDRRGNATASDGALQFSFDARPESADRISVDVTIERDGKQEQRATLFVSPDSDTAAQPARYTGDPISLNLQGADLNDVIKTFAKLTGTEMQVDSSVHAKVSVNWINVPWDEAFDSLLKDNGLTYHREGKILIISRR